MPYNFYLGIDVSKASLSVVLMNSDSKVLWSSKKIANQPSGFKQMVEHASKIASKHADGDDYWSPQEYTGNSSLITLQTIICPAEYPCMC